MPHVTIKAIGYILPESEVLGSFDIERPKMKDLLIKYDLFVRCALFTEIHLPTPFPSAQVE